MGGEADVLSEHTAKGGGADAKARSQLINARKGAEFRVDHVKNGLHFGGHVRAGALLVSTATENDRDLQDQGKSLLLGHFRLLVAKAAEQGDQRVSFGLGKGEMRTKILFVGKAEQLFAARGRKPNAYVVKKTGLLNNKDVNVIWTGENNVTAPQGIQTVSHQKRAVTL